MALQDCHEPLPGPRIEEYESRDRFEPIFAAFLDGVKSLNDPSLSLPFVEQHKDTFFKRSEKYTKRDKVGTLESVLANSLKLLIGCS